MRGRAAGAHDDALQLLRLDQQDVGQRQLGATSTTALANERSRSATPSRLRSVRWPMSLTSTARSCRYGSARPRELVHHRRHDPLQRHLGAGAAGDLGARRAAGRLASRQHQLLRRRTARASISGNERCMRAFSRSTSSTDARDRGDGSARSSLRAERGLRRGMLAKLTVGLEQVGAADAEPRRRRHADRSHGRGAFRLARRPAPAGARTPAAS